ncbi:MAG: hypothetical protein AB1776_08630 [Bacillota bacterium]
MKNVIMFLKDERGAATPSAVAAVALAAGGLALGLAQHREELAGLGLAGLAAGVKRVDGVDVLKVDHNIARQTQLFSRLPDAEEVPSAQVALPWRNDLVEMTGYKLDDLRAICVPADVAEYLKHRTSPATRLTLTALTTLFLLKPRMAQVENSRDLYGEVRTSLRELCQLLRLNPNSGKNVETIKKSLLTLHYLHYKGLAFYYVGEKEKKPTAKFEVWTVLLPYLKIASRLKKDDRLPESAVVAHLCPPLTCALLEKKTGVAVIPIRAIEATREAGPNGEAYAQNLLFYLAGSKPSDSNAITRYEDVLIEACHFEGTKRRREKLHKYLDLLRAGGYIKEWSVDVKGLYTIKINTPKNHKLPVSPDS